LTREGRKARFLIGGDCFDKGPSTLRLLRVIKILIDKGADVIILAGNHDIRMMLGIRSINMEPDPRTDHFFIRMGRKMELFLHPDGEFAWFYKHMNLCYRNGSFLFLHAGIDDRIAAVLSDKSWKQLNRKFRELMYDNPFDFYYGPFANIIRTKYRNVDMPLTRHGVKKIRNKGIHVMVHGHRNLYHGQRLMLRKRLLNVECDTTLDRNSRKKEGLKGQGAAVTIIHPKERILGISSDYPFIKVFAPALCAL
jgi:hypothetical protein